MPQADRDFSVVGPLDVVKRGMDFSPAMNIEQGETLLDNGVLQCLVTVDEGSENPDSSPQSRVLVEPTVNGTVASAYLGTMLDGVTYIVEFVAQTNQGQTLSLWTHQECQAP